MIPLSRNTLLIADSDIMPMSFISAFINYVTGRQELLPLCMNPF
jgi:hypothetical protein